MADFEFYCPFCRQLLRASEDVAGAPIDCPTCKHAIRVPVPSVQPFVPRDRKRILLADDEHDICELYRHILEAQHPECALDTVQDGSEAVRLFQERHHGVLFLDVRMPVYDGTWVFARIQDFCDEKHWEMPSIIFFTGHEPPTVIQDVVVRNPRHCMLLKPISGVALLEALEQRL